MQERNYITRIPTKDTLKFLLLFLFFLLNMNIMLAQKPHTITKYTGGMKEVYTLDAQGNYHGEYKIYDLSSDLLYMSKMYNHGTLDGVLKRYNSNGALRDEMIYQNGICVDNKTWETRFIDGHPKMTLTFEEIRNKNDSLLSYSDWSDDENKLVQSIGRLPNGGVWRYIRVSEIEGTEYQEEYPKNDTIYIWWNKNKINFKGKQINGVYSVKYAKDGSILNQNTANGHKIEKKPRAFDDGFITTETWSQKDTLYTIEEEETQKYRKMSKFYNTENRNYNEYVEFFYYDKEIKNTYKRILDWSTESAGYNIWYYYMNNDLQCKIFIAVKNNKKYATLDNFYYVGHTPFDNDINAFMSPYNLSRINDPYNLSQMNNPHNLNFSIYAIIKSNGDYFSTDMFDSLLDDKFKRMFNTSLDEERNLTDINKNETLKPKYLAAISKQGNKTTFHFLAMASGYEGVLWHNQIIFIDGKSNDNLYQQLYDIGNGLALHPKAIIRNALKIDMSIADFNTNKIKPQIIGQRLADLLNYLKKNVKRDKDVYLMLREILRIGTHLTSFKIINMEKNGNIIIIKTESSEADIPGTFHSTFKFENGVSDDKQTNELFTLIARKLESGENK